MKFQIVGSLFLIVAAGFACKTTAPVQSSVLEGDIPEGPCTAVRATHNMKVNNFTNAPLNNAAFFAEGNAESALANVVGLYRGDGCQAEVRRLLTEAQPNIYIYFTGFGGAIQGNQIVDEGQIMQWINRRDPNGLIFAVGWNCEQAVGQGADWCRRAARAYDSTPDKPEQKFLEQTYRALLPPEEAEKFINQTRAVAAQQQGGYNEALTNAIHNATALVDHLLHLNIGKIHFAGYSMGAHAAADVLIADFTDESETTGYKWSKPGVCGNGQPVCTIAELTKSDWSLAMGLSGWSHALQTYNEFDEDGAPQRAFAERRQYENGGLLRIKNERYMNKLNVFNRRMDPTSNSHDTAQRGINDAIFGDYNHYSHDYSQPPFLQLPFIKTLETFLKAQNPRDLVEFGIIHDAAAFVDFDTCENNRGNCRPKANYLAHRVNRRHSDLKIMEPMYPVKTVVGVPHQDRENNRAASFVRSQQPVTVQTMDQEDLRGGIEFYYMPKFDTADGQKRGLFSYGTCTGSSDDLMPQAWFESGNVVFSMKYQGQTYTARYPIDAATFKQDKWVHLAFTWDLPTFPISRNPLEYSDDGETLNRDVAAEQRQAALADDLLEYEQAIIVAATLRTASPTTFRKQKGQGFMRIYVNGEKAVEAKLGTEDSQRACLTAQEVLGQSSNYFVAEENGSAITYPPYLPYANYNAQMGDFVALGPGFQIGRKCKGFKIRNTQVHFGCAGEEGVTARGYMDDIAVIYGHGREKYSEVGRNGRPVGWRVGN